MAPSRGATRRAKSASRTVGDVVDAAAVGSFHRRLLLVTGCVWAATALSILVVAFTLPVFEAIWDLSTVEAGMLGSATLFGMVFGTSLGGRYADRNGRKPTLVAAVALFTASTALTGLAVGFRSAFLLRFLTGLGVGATVTVDATYLSEHVPTRCRGRYLAYLEGFFALGNLLTVIVAAVVLPAGVTDATVLGVPAWRVTFFAAGTPVVLAAVVHATLSESPYYLARTGQLEAACDRLRTIAAESGSSLGVSAEQLRAGDGTEPSFGRLLQPDLVGRTLSLSAVWVGLNLGYYGVFIWLPDTIQAAGYVGGLYAYLTVVGVFQLLGVLAAAALVDRVGRRRVLATSFLLAGVSTAAFAVALPGVDAGLGVSGPTVLLAGLFATGFFIFACFAVVFGYTTEVFPTAVRSSGLGFAAGVGKVAAVAGPVLAGALRSSGYLATLAPFALALAAAGAVVAVGPETAGRTLE